jgi:hypothetical protein
MTFSDIDLTDLRLSFSRLTPTTRPMSKRALVKEMLGEIDEALKRGLTFEQIRQHLDENGFAMGLSTFKQYVAMARNNASATSKPKKQKRRKNRAVEIQSALGSPQSTNSTTSPITPQGQAATNPQDALLATPGTDPRKFTNIDDKDL